MENLKRENADLVVQLKKQEEKFQHEEEKKEMMLNEYQHLKKKLKESKVAAEYQAQLMQKAAKEHSLRLKNQITKYQEAVSKEKAAVELMKGVQRMKELDIELQALLDVWQKLERTIVKSHPDWMPHKSYLFLG